MKQKLQGILIGIVITSLLTSGLVFAKEASETISVIYDNIKILIDGVEYTAKDANGNVIEPFIYNGTTYLPVRGIANAFGKDVAWEAQTGTISLGSRNYDWLDQMGYANFETSGEGNTLTAWKENQKGSDDIMYHRGLRFQLGLSQYGNGAKKNDDGTLVSFQSVEYLLNNKYSTFSGKMICATKDDYDQSVIVKVFGDGNLLYTSPVISSGTKAIDFNVNVDGCKTLKLYVNIPNLNDPNISFAATSIGIVDARIANK